MKTLSEMLSDSANPVAHKWHGEYCVILPGYSHATACAIFGLRDYRVHSCEGGCYWLAPVSHAATVESQDGQLMTAQGI